MKRSFFNIFNIAEHLSPSLIQEENMTAKESVYTIKRKIHMIGFWINTDLYFKWSVLNFEIKYWSLKDSIMLPTWFQLYAVQLSFKLHPVITGVLYNYAMLIAVFFNFSEVTGSQGVNGFLEKPASHRIKIVSLWWTDSLCLVYVW